MAWQGNGMGVAWERHGMCELAFTILGYSDAAVLISPPSWQLPVPTRVGISLFVMISSVRTYLSI
jgi:hypothetical protein